MLIWKRKSTKLLMFSIYCCSAISHEFGYEKSVRKYVSITAFTKHLEKILKYCVVATIEYLLAISLVQ